MKRLLILFLVLSCFWVYGKDHFYFGPGNPAFLTTHEIRGALIWKDGTHHIRPDLENKLREIYANNGCNCIRIWSIGIWGKFTKKQAFTPFKYVEPEGKWDLDRFNPRYFELTNEIIDMCNRSGLTVWFVPFDMCGTLSNQPIHKNPWCNNINGVKHWIDDFGRSKKWMLKYLHEFKKRRVNYEPNEFDLHGKCSFAIGKDAPRFKARKFAFLMWETYYDAGIPAERLGYGARYHPEKKGKQLLHMLSYDRKQHFENGRFRNAPLGKENINKDYTDIYRDVHIVHQPDKCGDYGCYFEKAHEYWLGGNGSEHNISVKLSVDGANVPPTYPGAVDCDFKNGKPYRCRPPAVSLGKAFALAYKTHKTFRPDHPIWFEVMPRNFFDVEMQTEEIRSISVALSEVSGRLPENFDQFQVEHECEIGDEKWIQFQGNPQGIKTHECRLCEDGVRRMIEIDYEVPNNPTEPEEKPEQKDGANPLWIAAGAILLMIISAVFGRKKNKK